MNIKIRAIIPDEPGHASNWWRIIKPFDLLNEYGIDAKYYTHRSVDLFDLHDAIVIVHRMIPSNSSYYIRDLRNAGVRRIIYSMDDYTIDATVLREYLEACQGLTTSAIDTIIGRIPNQIEFINMCDGILVSTHDLAKLIFDVVHVPLFVIENMIYTAWFESASYSEDTPYQKNGSLVHIGYASGRRPASDFYEMAKAWNRINNEFERVRFVVAGYPNDVLDSHVDLDKRIRIPWQSLEQHPSSMRVDIGCCPLFPTTYNMGKSPIKYFEYTLAGAAVVASSIVYDTVIEHKKNGFIAKNEYDWYRYLKLLIINPKLRNRVHMKASDSMVNHALESGTHIWLDFFTELS